MHILLWPLVIVASIWLGYTIGEQTSSLQQWDEGFRYGRQVERRCAALEAEREA